MRPVIETIFIPKSFVSRFGNLTIGHGTERLGLSASLLPAGRIHPIPAYARLYRRMPRLKRGKIAGSPSTMCAGAPPTPQSKAGVRIAGTHSAGDKATDVMLGIIEKASAEAGLSLEQIRAKNHAIHYCTLINLRPDQIERAKKLNIMWSCAPKYLLRAERVMRDYGEEAAQRRVLPIQGILDAGGRVTWEQDDADLGIKPFFGLGTLVTRKDENDRAWGARHAIDRRTALLMATRWASQYVLRDQLLGSLEAGKWGDMVVFWTKII